MLRYWCRKSKIKIAATISKGGDSMNQLHTINAEDLQNRTYEPTHFLVDELIPEGLHILAGAPKIGKSWLALWLCLCVAQGQTLWNFATTQGEVLYLSLEDSFQRVQTRLFDLTEDAPPSAALCDYGKHAQALAWNSKLSSSCLSIRQQNSLSSTRYSVSAVRAVTAICMRMTIRTSGF